MPRLWFYLIGILLLSGCQQSAAAPGKEGGAPPPMSVSVAKPIVKEISDVEEFTGRVEAVDKVDIRSQVTGYLEKIHFKSGYEVKKGDLLFTIDDRLYAAEYDSAKGMLAQAEARQQKMKADLERAKKLMQTSGAMSQEEFDKINADASEAVASVATARANLDRAQKNLAYTKITAPVAGRISRNLITEGNLVSANTTILTDIVSIDPVHIYFDIDERTILRIQDMIQKGKFVSAQERLGQGKGRSGKRHRVPSRRRD
ncbi:MAG: efflux RND transporter periplasmic adaptor subunit [Gemmatales bacterium]